MEYSVVSRLPPGSRVVLLERQGLWARVTPPQGQLEGWIPQRYLIPEGQIDPKEQADLSPQQEQRRFARLRRKGIITVHRSETTGLLRLTINPLVWHRLTPYQQENFLRRAQRFFGGSVVEMRDRRNAALLARLTATGEVEFATQLSEAQPSPDNAASTRVPPVVSKDTGQGR
jgi:hypothetical protein